MSNPSFSPPTQKWFESGRHIALGRRRLFLYERGAGPAVLLIHGFPTSGYDWRGVCDQLGKRYRTLAPDLLGFGLSDKPEACGYSLFDQADLLEWLLGELHVAEAHLVSHDLGTSVHCELLARRQRGELSFGVRSSTFLNGSMLQWEARITPFQELLSANGTLPQGIELCRTSFRELYVPGLKSIMQRPEAISAEDATVMQELLEYQQGYARLPAIAGYMRERYVHADRWLGALGDASVPTNIVWADGDPIAHAEMGRRTAERAPHARYVELSGVGHFLLMEDPPRVAHEIEQSLAAGG